LSGIAMAAEALAARGQGAMGQPLPMRRRACSASSQRSRLRAVSVLACTFFLQIQTAEAAAGGGGLGSFSGGFGASFGSFSQWLNHGPGAGALVIGREDLLRVRTSLGRISDELHLILGVLDQHLDGTASSAAAAAIDDRNAVKARAFEPLPREVNASELEARRDAAKGSLVGAGVSYIWSFGEWLFTLGIFGLDMGIVVGMQLFLESIGKKRGGSSIMPKKGVASAMAKASGPAHGTPIPAPSGAMGRERLSVLSQEEFLAALLAEHWGKIAIGAGLAIISRLPVHILNNDGILCHMLMNLAVMLRWMSLVMLLIRDDVALPKREKESMPENIPAPPRPPSPRSPLSPRSPRSPRRRPSGLASLSLASADGSG